MSYADIRRRMMTYNVVFCHYVPYDVVCCHTMSYAPFQHTTSHTISYTTSHKLSSTWMYGQVASFTRVVVSRCPRKHPLKIDSAISSTTFHSCSTCTHTRLPRIPYQYQQARHTSYHPLLASPFVSETSAVPFFSKELVAYLETLIASSVYYLADDACMSWMMEPFYTQGLRPSPAGATNTASTQSFTSTSAGT